MIKTSETLANKGFEARCFQKFGFNGKEKDDEITVTGGDYDFGARIYGSRLGRWMSVDPEFKKYPSLSGYSSFENNPIAILDPGGDTTVFFTQSGMFLAKIDDDGFPDQPVITIIKDENLNDFMKGLSFYKDCKDPTIIKAAVSTARNMGTSIDVNAWRQFSNDATASGGEADVDNSDYFLETSVWAYKKNNMVKPGTNTQTKGNDVNHAYYDNLQVESDLGEVVGQGHTHPNEEKPGFSYGPSYEGNKPSDILTAYYHKNKINVVVGTTNIYVYDDQLLKNKFIKVDIKTLAPDLEQNPKNTPTINN